MKRKIATLARYLIVFIPFMLLTGLKKKPILISGYGFFGISMLFFLVMFAYFNARQLDAQRKNIHDGLPCSSPVPLRLFQVDFTPICALVSVHSLHRDPDH